MAIKALPYNQRPRTNSRAEPFAPEIDLSTNTERVRQQLGFDAENPDCKLDLDIFINGNFDEDALTQLRRCTIAQGLWGSQFAETQTIPNLVAEMTENLV